MIIFFQGSERVFAVQTVNPLKDEDIRKLSWLFGNADSVTQPAVPKKFVGPRKEIKRKND